MKAGSYLIELHHPFQELALIVGKLLSSGDFVGYRVLNPYTALG